MTNDRVLLVGEFQADRLGASHERAFKALGHEVIRFDIVGERFRLAMPARNRILHRATIRSLNLRRHWSHDFNQALVEQAKAARVGWTLIHNGEWVMPETIRKLRQIGVRSAIFNADNPLPPHYNNRPETLEAAREADLYLTWSRRLVEALRQERVRAEFLAFGWDPEVFPYQGLIPQGSWPGVVFIGGWDRHREELLDELADHVPVRIYGPRYWGTRTRRTGRARAAWQRRALSMETAARVLRESAISLNILRSQHQIDGIFDGVIMRHFEVPGAGGFLLSTRSGVAVDLFPEGETGAYFSGIGECIERCKEFLADPEARALRAERAHVLVSERHSYTQRVAELIRMMHASN